MLNKLDLTGKVALVTGGSKGLGRAAADALAECGADLVITSRTPDEIETAAAEIADGWGHRAVPMAVDQADQDAIEAAVAETVGQFGRLDILVNNAGINIREPLVELQDESWDAVIQVDLSGVMWTTRAAVKPMIEAGYGRIVNIGSVLSTFGGVRRSSYAAAKGGVLQLTKCWALELAEHNITCNCVCPGPFRTPLNIPWMNDPVESEATRSKTALKRFGEPDELAGAVLLLASDLGSFITGTAIYVDGGLTCS